MLDYAELAIISEEVFQLKNNMILMVVLKSCSTRKDADEEISN
jgi:hypothetical protein